MTAPESPRAETAASEDRSPEGRPTDGLQPDGPRTDLIATIRDRLDGLRPAEQRVASAILADVPRAVEDSSAALAARAEVSEPTVTRFCRSVGCDGVRDFKLALARSLVVGQLYLDTPSAPPGDDDLPPYWATVLGEAHRALEQVAHQVSPTGVTAAAAAVAQARQVVVMGLGGSAGPLALETQHRLFRYGVAISACTDPYIMRMTTATLGPHDVVICISVSGKTAEMVDIAALARAYRVPTIAVTAAASPLAGAVDHPLVAAIAEYPDTLTPTSARFAQLAIIDLLAAATGYALGPRARETLRRIKYAALNHRDGPMLEPLGD